MSLSPSIAKRPGTGRIRQLRPSDFPHFRDHLLRLDRESRRDRFNGPASDATLRAYADRCFHDGTTVVGFVQPDGTVHGAAELHERPELEDAAEIAFSVERDLQHQGIGRRLFKRLLGHARALGYTKLLVTTHPANEAMKRLARHFDARLTFADGETVGLIELDDASTSLPSASRGGVGEAPFVSEY
jgi:GNAT superfamily N-acetyltransferase